MAWIKQIPDSDADGLLKEQYEAARRRAGRVFNIVRVMSLNAPVMRDSMAFYISLMKGPSPLTRSQRELIATVVSAEVGCHYWTQAHADDLRAEVATEKGEEAAEAFAQAVATDWRRAELPPLDHGLCEFAALLTHGQHEIRKGHLDVLRSLGLDDRAIHDAVQVVGYFNYITRVADALGVEAEDHIPLRGPRR